MVQYLKAGDELDITKFGLGTFIVKFEMPMNFIDDINRIYDDAKELWEWAWTQPVERIVVKRPLREPVLGAHRPSHTLSGKSVRFDVFVRNKQVDSISQAEV